MRLIHTLIILCLILTVACHRQEHDPRLLRAADLAEHSYEEALAALDSIDPSELSDGDRHFRDLLTIKAKDKNYVKHTSDSLILDVLSYYDRHKDDPYYPEALYYGGRVYSDLGDYPTSLSYFHRALDELPNDKDHLHLKSHVLSQTGRLLNKLKLYNEAIPYIAKSVELDSVLNDCINEVHDLHLLGYIVMQTQDYNIAEKYFRKALFKSKELSGHHVAKSSMYLGAVKLKKGDISSALTLIRNTPGSVSDMAKNTALSYAVQIYGAAGLIDTACMYAEVLVHSRDNTNKQIGYQTLLSPEARSIMSPDSIDSYISGYTNILATLFNENENQLALTQQSHYNYSIHEREKENVIKEKDFLRKIVSAGIWVLVIFAFIILFFKNRNKDNIIRLQQALSNINRLNEELKFAKNHSSADESPSGKMRDIDNVKPMTADPETPNEKYLRDKLRKELESLYKTSSTPSDISKKILDSDIYFRLQNMADSRQHINTSGGDWEELQRVVLEVSPNFISNLRLLTSGNVTLDDIHAALLIKCGFRPSQMIILMGKSNGALISRKSKLGFKIMNQKLNINEVVTIISSL